MELAVSMPVRTNHPHIEMVSHGALQPNPKNPRNHSAKQLQQIANSIERFGFIVPIVCDDDGLIVAGHGRWAGAALLKMDAVPVVRVQFVSEADRRAFALAENRLADLSDFDPDLLAAELEYLFEHDYDLDITGFTLDDLSIDSGDTTSEETVELPNPDSAAVTQAGDLWQIGPHRIYCGNSRAAISYEALLGGELAAMVFSDSPYNVKIDGHVSGLGKTHHREFAEASGEMNIAEFTAFLRSIFRQCARFSRPGSIHYQCMDFRHMREMLDAAEGVYTEFKQLVVWTRARG